MMASEEAMWLGLVALVWLLTTALIAFAVMLLRLREAQ